MPAWWVFYLNILSVSTFASVADSWKVIGHWLTTLEPGETALKMEGQRLC